MEKNITDLLLINKDNIENVEKLKLLNRCLSQNTIRGPSHKHSVGFMLGK